MSNSINYGMVGGGMGAFIGEIHRIAAKIDNNFNLVGGTFSSDPSLVPSIDPKSVGLGKKSTTASNNG